MTSRRPAKTFRDLVVWQKAHAFVLQTYAATRAYPREEQYGLALQFRRAAVSVAANIAEGFTKRTRTDKARFMNIAQGSLEECRYYTILSADLGYAHSVELEPLCEEVSKLLEAYRNTILDSGS